MKEEGFLSPFLPFMGENRKISEFAGKISEWVRPGMGLDPTGVDGNTDWLRISFPRAMENTVGVHTNWTHYCLLKVL